MSQKYPSSIYDLPNEILFEILSDLDHKSLLNVALVSRRLRDIARELVSMKFRFVFNEYGAYDGPVELALGVSSPNAVEFKLVGGTGQCWECFDEWVSSSQYSFRLLQELTSLQRLKYVIHDSYCMLDRHFCISPLPQPLGVEHLCIFHTYGSFCVACLGNFLSSFEKLQSLDLFYQSITDAEMKIVFRFLGHLVDLSVSGCLDVTDKGLEDMRNLNKLKTLSLYKIKKVTDEGMRYLVLPELQEIKLSRLEMVSENGVCDLVQHCPKLRRIFIFECTSFNDKCIEVILKGLPDLQHLRIEGCRNFTARCKQIIRNYCPRPNVGIYLGSDEE